MSDSDALGGGPRIAPDEPAWYAVYTRSRHEKLVDAALREKGVRCFLPAVDVLSRWQDRRKLVRKPLFPGYLFAFARALEGAGRVDEALESCREAVAVAERGDDTSRIAQRRGQLGGLLLRTGDGPAGEAMLIEAWSTLAAEGDGDDARGAAAALADYYAGLGRDEDAALWRERSEPPPDAGG